MSSAPQRVIDTPISETGFIGIATGAAMAGMRPIIEIAFVDFIGVCFNQIFNFAAKTHYMSGGQFKMPLTMMIGYGGGYNDAAQHSQCLIATLAHVPGIRIATPADSYDAKGLMHTCLRDDNLTHLDGAQAHLGPRLARHCAEDRHRHGAGRGIHHSVRPGAHLERGQGRHARRLRHHRAHALAAAEKLAAEGISAEVLDLRTIVPMDREAIFKSVSKTGRLVVADEDYMNCGVTAEVLAVVAERDPRVLKAPADPRGVSGRAGAVLAADGRFLLAGCGQDRGRGEEDTGQIRNWKLNDRYRRTVGSLGHRG